MKQLFFAFIGALLLSGCKKSAGENADSSYVPNWKIVKNFPDDKSYETASIAVYKGNAYVTSFGHRGIKAGSEGTLSNTFSGSFFFLNGSEWYVNTLPDQAVIALKEFNGSLYGVREKKTVYRTSPVVEYQHSYTLFRWENNNYTDLDVLQYTNANGIEKSMLESLDLWINNSRLYVVATINGNTTRLWEVNNAGKLVAVPGEIYPLPIPRLLTDNKEIAHTSVYTVVQGYITKYYVKGHYFDNSSVLRIGTTHEFYTEQLVDGSVYKTNKDVNWHAVNGNLFGIGFGGNKVKNHDNGNVLAELLNGKLFRDDVMIRKNGKLYMMLGDEKAVSACKGLAVFDGITVKEIPFNLPELLDPCAQLIDATEHNGKFYLLLNSRRQYVIVESI